MKRLGGRAGRRGLWHREEIALLRVSCQKGSGTILRAFASADPPPPSLRAELSNSLARLAPHPEVLDISQGSPLSICFHKMMFPLGRRGREQMKKTKGRKAQKEAAQEMGRERRLSKRRQRNSGSSPRCRGPPRPLV